MKEQVYISFFIVFTLVSVLICNPSSIVLAETDNIQRIESEDDFEEDMSGFEDDDTGSGFGEDSASDISSLNLSETEAYEDRLVQFGGFFKEDIGYSYEHEDDQPEFSKVRSVLNLTFDIRLSDEWRSKLVWNSFYDYAYQNHGRDKFTDDTLDTYESEAEIRDLFVDGAIFSWLRLKVGRQVIAWGESEVDQITDMANPRDNRELGIVDLEDARIPVAATKISLLFGSWETNLVAIHENRPNKTPGAGSEFDPLGTLRESFNIEDEEIPANNSDNTEYLVRIFKSFNGGDISIVWADVFSDSYHLDFESFDATAASKNLTVTPRHKRIRAIGFSGNMVQGSFLLKTELARKTGQALARNQKNLSEQLVAAAVLAQSTATFYFGRDSGLIEIWSEKDTSQGMLGVEYSGFDDLTISLEGSLEKIEAYEDNLSSSELTGSTTFHTGYTALNDRFNADFYWFHLTDDNGDVVRFNLDYDIRDALNLSGGIILYEAEEEDALIYPFRKNDRIFTALKYSF